MELIATARFKKAMDRATEAAAYTAKISEIVADLSGAATSFVHPLLQTHPEEKTVAVLVLTSNRGLCGGYNGGVLRTAVPRLRELRAADRQVVLEVSGKRGLNFLRFQGLPVDASYTHFEDRPAFDQVEELANRFVQWYVTGKIDRLEVAYTRFLSSSRQQAVLETLLPIGSLASTAAEARKAHGAAAKEAAPGGQAAVEYEFLPSAQEILEEIVPAAFKARLFKCFLDAAVSEQIARMVAMKGATENADDMIGQFKQQYNRARQAQITNELAEIVGAVAALS
jgi:F-type H+-transporting ATPase subunit gamma